MTTYISLLRGINVGGHKKIKMADLRALYATLDVTNVRSYIQSGNVVFDSAEQNRQILASQIETAIEGAYGFYVPVLLRTADELAQLIEQNPLLSFTDGDGKNHYVLFLGNLLNETQLAKLGTSIEGKEQFVVLGDAILIYYPNGAGRSKLSTNYFERKLGISGTMRNWRSVNKLLSMAGEGEGRRKN
ncbi:MAG: DUF1697 domain-containing protein [Candidatus Promineifilaceae bacterium]